MNIALSTLMGGIGLLLVICVWSERFRIPLLAEFGLASISLGMFGAAAAISSGVECSSQALQGIWSLIGVGLLLVLLSWRIRARHHRTHRRNDPVTVDYTALRDVHGGRR